MARPSRQTPAPSALVPALLRYLHGRGVDTSLVACRFGLPADAEDHDEVPVNPASIGELVATCAELLREPYLGLRLPADLPLRHYGAAELAARSSATVRAALSHLAQYASLVHPELACALEETRGEGRWHQRTPAHPRGVGRHVHEYGLAFALTQCRAGAGEGLDPTRVWFGHARPPDLAPLYRFFGTRDLGFGHVDSGFALSTAALDAPMRQGDPRLLATAQVLAEAALRAQPRSRKMAALVAERLPSLLPEDATIEAAARAFHMSGRTLQRRLEEEGTTFSDVLDGVRQELARRWLADASLALGEVGFRLGFSDLATFSRAFKRWTGKPPGTWRRS